jgi:hypothetical protein
MSFGKNPHVAKAEAAEQNAQDAKDDIAREQAWLEAARRWDRAAERETDGKRRKLYNDKAEQARVNATEEPKAAVDAVDAAPEAAHPPSARPSATLLN